MSASDAAASPASQAAPAVEFDPRRLVADHQAGVWRYLRTLGCDPSEADDLTQETFLKVLERPFQQYSTQATAAYLRRVAHNLLISARRRSNRVTLVQDLEIIYEDWERWAPEDQGTRMLAALRECFQHLSQRARMALEMRFRERRKRVDIATALEITEHGARNLMQRAKQRLRTCVEGKLQ